MRRSLVLAAALCALAWAGAAQAGTASISGNEVDYAAPSGEANRVFVVFEESPVRGARFIDTGAPVTAGTGCTSVGANEAFCATPDFPNQILVTTDDMDDYVNSAAATVTNVRLEGGAGSDTLYSGHNFNADQDGGPGADTMSGEGATVDYSARTNPLTVSLGDGLANDGETGENDLIGNDVSEVLGGSGNDTFTATGSSARVAGGPGADHITATGLAFCGLDGGKGNDRIETDGGFCTLGGASGNDVLVGGVDAQLMSGGDGSDVLKGGPGRDSLAGDGGDDELIGGKGRDHMRGGSDDDTFRARDGVSDFIDGNHGTDRAHVDQGLDEIHDIEQLF